MIYSHKQVVATTFLTEVDRVRETNRVNLLAMEPNSAAYGSTKAVQNETEVELLTAAVNHMAAALSEAKDAYAEKNKKATWFVSKPAQASVAVIGLGALGVAGYFAGKALGDKADIKLHEGVLAGAAAAGIGFVAGGLLGHAMGAMEKVRVEREDYNEK